MSDSTETSKPSPEPKVLWSDIAEEENSFAEAKLKEDAAGPLKDKSDVAGPSEDKSAEQLEKLTISEEGDIFNDALDEVEDSKIQAITSGDTLYTSASSFEDLKLSEALLKGLYVEMNFSKPSKIQAVSLPMILTPPHLDLIAQAHNGSGKTTCFTLGMLSRVDPQLKRPQALCICPTRELSLQNLEVLKKMGKYTGITSEAAIPLDDPRNDKSRVRPPVMSHIVIGTPGTVKRLMSLKKLSILDMKILVFDEADHMLSKDGFQDDSLRIMKEIVGSSVKCQVLLFSATFDEAVKNFVSRIVKREHNQLFVKKEELSLESIKQYKVSCPDELAKIHVVTKVLDLGDKIGQTIIFVKSKQSARMLHLSLEGLGYGVTTIHGALTHDLRDKIVREFKDGLTHVLISTDLLARGFDQKKVNLVVNYDLPVKFENPSEPNYEVYLHRIGRAGRFGRKGAVFNFLMEQRDVMIMEKIEKYFGCSVSEVPSWNDDKDFTAALHVAQLL